MNVTILDDYFDTLHTLPCFAKLAGHNVTVWNDHVQDTDALAERLRDTEALVLIRERTAIRAPLLERLPKLRFISQRSVYPHIDVDACTRLGIVVSSNQHADTPSYAAAELTWGLVLAAMRRIPQQVAALKRGVWQSGVWHGLRGKTLGIYGYGRIGAVVAGYGRAFGMKVLVWARRSFARARAGRRLRGRAQQGAVLRGVRRRVAAHAAGRSDARHRHRRGPGAHEAHGAPRQHQPRRSDRARRAGRGAARRAARHGGGRRVRERAAPRPGRTRCSQMENVVCTPHLGYVTREEYEIQFSDIFDQVVAYAAGAPINVVNPQVLRALALRGGSSLMSP